MRNVDTKRVRRVNYYTQVCKMYVCIQKSVYKMHISREAEYRFNPPYPPRLLLLGNSPEGRRVNTLRKVGGSY